MAKGDLAALTCARQDVRLSRNLPPSADHAWVNHSVIQIVETHLQGFSASADEVPVLLMMDTAGCDMEEQAEEDGDSKRNDGEAKVSATCNGCYQTGLWQRP